VVERGSGGARASAGGNGDSEERAAADEGAAARPGEVEAVGPPGAAGPAGERVASLPGRVVERRYAGPISYYAVRLDAGPEVEVLAAESAGEPLAAEGDRVRVTLSGRGPAPRIFTAAEPATGAVRDGDPASPQSPSEAAGPAAPGGDG
jgi:hypothetical protein